MLHKFDQIAGKVASYWGSSYHEDTLSPVVVAEDGGAEDLRDAHNRAIDAALVAADLLDQLAPGVQQEDDHLFGVEVRQVEHHQVRRVHRRADLIPGPRLQQASRALSRLVPVRRTVAVDKKH